jgi:hypothetical protein
MTKLAYRLHLESDDRADTLELAPVIAQFDLNNGATLQMHAVDATLQTSSKTERFLRCYPLYMKFSTPQEAADYALQTGCTIPEGDKRVRLGIIMGLQDVFTVQVGELARSLKEGNITLPSTKIIEEIYDDLGKQTRPILTRTNYERNR